MGTAFVSCRLVGATFFGAVGERCNFQDTNIEKADFSHAKIPAGMFMSVPARGANFTAADLPNVRFYRAVLRETMFDKANLFQADMRKAVLTDASFRTRIAFRRRYRGPWGRCRFPRRRTAPSQLQPQRTGEKGMSSAANIVEAVQAGRSLEDHVIADVDLSYRDLS